MMATSRSMEQEDNNNHDAENPSTNAISQHQQQQHQPACQDLLSSDLEEISRNQQQQQQDVKGGNEPTSNYVSMEVVTRHEEEEEAKRRMKGSGSYDGKDGGRVPPVPEYNDDDDDDDDDCSLAHSIVSSVLTADGIHDITGFYVICLVVLIGDMSRGVMFPSMWPLVESLGGSQVLLGYSVASFSFGRILVSPLFGSWSHQIGYSKTLTISTSILLVGTLIYAQVQNIGHPEFLIVAQTVLGIGSGTLGVTRAFVAEVTATRNRTTYMALLTAVQYAGFTVTPFFGALFNTLLLNVDVNIGILRLNMYTAPAYFMSFICIGTLYVLSTRFRDRQRLATTKDAKEKKKNLSKRRQHIDDTANAVTWIGITVYDCCILGCMLLNVSTKGSIASFETLGIAIAQANFDLMASRAGVIVAACGSMGVVALLCMGQISYYFTDIQLINGGMLIMSVGIYSLSFLNHEGMKTPSWRYAFAMFLIYSIGYPIGHTAVIGLFSKIVGRRPQGTLLGWFASAGSAARMFFPVLSGYIASYKDVETLFVLLTCVLLVSILFCLYSRKTLSLLSS